jgi:hypothetical protein
MGYAEEVGKATGDGERIRSPRKAYLALSNEKFHDRVAGDKREVYLRIGNVPHSGGGQWCDDREKELPFRRMEILFL